MNNRNQQCQRCFSIEFSNAVFCSQCGTRFPMHNSSENTVIETAYENKKLIIIGAVAIVFFMGLVMLSVVIGAFSSSNKVTANNTALSTVSQSNPTPEIPITQISAKETIIVGKVVGVSDGDTVTVLDENNKQQKIRLEGIDAPESKQDFGEKAKKNLSDLIYGKEVTVISNKTDKYGRKVGKILLDGKDINLEQIKSGYAWHYKQYAEEQSKTDQKLYADAEVTAKGAKLNLWSLNNPVAPWNFRNGSDVKPEDKNKIFGNKDSMIYHWSNCPGFTKISASNRVVFQTVEEAEEAGYRAAKNCSTPQPVIKAEESEDSLENVYEAGSDNPYSTPVYVPQPITVSRDIPVPTPYQAPTYVRPDPIPQSTPVIASGAGASARCADGTYSYSQNRRGTCSHHGGVSEWLSNAPDANEDIDDTSDTYSSPSPTYSAPSSAPKTVNVRGYYRRDGTYVRPHTRSAPRRNN